MHWMAPPKTIKQYFNLTLITVVPRSCGYGTIMSQTWPGFNAASISVNSTLFTDPGAPLNGCGRCIEVQCKAPVWTLTLARIFACLSTLVVYAVWGVR